MTARRAPRPARRPLAPVFLSAALFAVGASAQQHPSHERGFDPEKVYQLGGLDSVNLLNGNVAVTLPLGLSFPVSGQLAYGLTLVYNSKVWDFQEVFFQGIPRSQALPDRLSNAGLGWSLSLGRLLAPTDPENDHETGRWAYLGPDGGEHLFYAGLQTTDPPGSNPCISTCFSRDGSYLRLRTVGATKRELDFPDGTIHVFQRVAFAGETRWRLTAIRDRFDATMPDVTVAYDAGGAFWEIGDRHGRRHQVVFRTDPAGRYLRLVDRVDLALAGSPPVAYASYQFAYAAMPVAVPCGSTLPGWNAVNVPLLTKVTLPDLSTFEAAYHHPQDGGTCHARGTLQRLQLPTRGALEYTYRQQALPIRGCSTREFLSQSAAVATRKREDAAGADLGTWTYTASLSTSSIPPNAVVCDNGQVFHPPPEELTVTVTTPLKDREMSYFSVFPGTETPWPSAFSPEDYGLPFTRRLSDTTATRSLSTRVFDCNETTGACPAAPVRSAFVRYERDGPGACVSRFGPECTDVNRRPASERTAYHDDGTRFAGSDSSDFDGFGHYRTVTTHGNFNAGDQRTVITNFNPNNVLPSASSWVLGTFTEQSVSEGGKTAKLETCFDPETGFLLRRRQIANLSTGNRGVNDVIWQATPRAATGEVEQEEWYGGDPQSLGPGANLCGLGLPASPEARLVHTYQAGVRATTAFHGPDGAVSFLSLDQTIDPRTGLVSVSRDTTGLATGFEYDAFGRQTWSKPAPGHGGWTEIAYPPADAATGEPAKAQVWRRDNGSKTAAVLAESEVLFDGLGRVWQERELLPGGWSTRETRYDKAGNRVWVSELQAGAPSQATELLSFDPFGRPATIRPPDGPGHDVTLTYAGVRRVTRTVKVGTARNASTGAITETAAGTTELYDRQGRLWRVNEPSGAAGAEVTTEYAYDPGDRLRQVLTTATAGGTPVTQTRTFTYDGLGFLRSEAHPEKGPAGGGTVTYPRYDARGNLLRKVDGPSDLTFAYDDADRPTFVTATAGGAVLKAFTYGDSNASRNNGKLLTATRHNYVGSSDAVLTTAYQYLGRDGRVSRRTVSLAFDSTPAESFTQTFSYTALGNPDALGYPVCTHAACQAPPPVFADVLASHPRAEIEAIQRAGVTAGCGVMPPRYCPDGQHSRAEMAVFLLVAKEGAGYQPPPCVTPAFADVPCSHPFARWIEELFRRSITGGCGNGNFCPNATVTHGQMAVFLLATEGTGLPPPACTAAPFADVPCSHPFAAWIAEAARRGILDGCATCNYFPAMAVTRARMAVLLTRTFGLPVAVNPRQPRTVRHTYTNGYLTAVTGYGSLSYHPNGLVHRVSHDNGAADTQINDPNGLRRPAAITTAFGGVDRWSTGPYSYDGAGNVTKMGTAWFLYDRVSRLVQGSLDLAPTGGGAQPQQSYTFDPFGNLTAVAGTNGRNIPVNPNTNRLSGAATYDDAGNLTAWNGAAYEYDPFHRMSHMVSGSEDWRYAYTADDERVWMFKVGANTSRWTLRGLGGEVLREYVNDGQWRTDRDYVYRDGQLLAAEGAHGRRHFHLDHLGTPRLITNRVGYAESHHAYFPFGEEATAFDQDTDRMKFTGHERDLASPAGAGDDLDYMHARHCSPITGRFLSVDPVNSAKPKVPQTWNKYAYAADNPLKYIDPDGKELRLGSGSHARALAGLRLMLPPALRNSVDVATNKRGQTIVTVDNSVRTSDKLFKNLQRVVNSPGVVELNLVSSNDPVTIKWDTRSIGTYQFGSVKRVGITLPSEGTAVGNEGAFSSETGVTEIYITNAAPVEQQAVIIAAEIGAHALPALLGQGAAPVNDADHKAREDPLKDAARSNARP